MRVRLFLSSALVVAGALAAGLALPGAGGRAGAAVQVAQAAGDRGLPRVLFTTADGATAALPVEVADDGAEVVCGLMYRTEMPEEQAMLFVSGVGFGAFWNKNTFLPLAVAYIATDGTIVDIVDMAPIQPGELPTTQRVRVPPDVVISYVIEANAGWYDRHGVAIGDHADVWAALAAADAAAPPPVSPC